jgi:type I restriction enzyme R subunit
MSGQTNERAFESYVETILHDKAGWKSGDLAEWDEARALFPARVFAFLQETQPTLWDQMRALHGAGLEELLVNTLVKELDLKGSLHILRHGFKFYGKTFRLAYFKPGLITTCSRCSGRTA